MNWSACQLPRSDKWDQSSVWGSANSTCSVAGFCSCCLTMMHTSSFNCQIGPLDVLGTSVTASSSPLPSRHSPGRVIENGADSTAEMCRQGRLWMHTDAFANAFTDMYVSAYCCAYMHTFADVSINVDNTDGSANTCRRPWMHLLLTPPMVRWDIRPLI